MEERKRTSIEVQSEVLLTPEVTSTQRLKLALPLVTVSVSLPFNLCTGTSSTIGGSGGQLLAV